MTYKMIWVSYCPACKSEFGHIQKTRAMNIWKQHQKHWIDLPELALKELGAHYESLLMKQANDEHPVKT